jgi:hypothetical protein
VPNTVAFDLQGTMYVAYAGMPAGDFSPNTPSAILKIDPAGNVGTGGVNAALLTALSSVWR